ncbi:hypothetical protein IWX90DRAFT_488731 [Phyllosticta citrichinensis]|uniref:Uncharacterized protein n=1 Tax=Phyllosticta citrichinensis TaxID=1130410 RepID=A0ABR1XK89_9PEZI
METNKRQAAITQLTNIVKQELKDTVNYRLHTKSQPFRKIGQLLYCDVNRFLTQRSAEIHRKRLRGEPPPRVKNNLGKMERALAKMNLSMGGDRQGDDVSMTEGKPVIGQHNSSIGEKRKRSGSNSNSNSDSSPARPSKLMHMEHSSAGNALQEYKDISAAIDGEFKISKEALATTIETDIARVDFYRHHFDNFAVILQVLSVDVMSLFTDVFPEPNVQAAQLELLESGLAED